MHYIKFFSYYIGLNTFYTDHISKLAATVTMSSPGVVVQFFQCYKVTISLMQYKTKQVETRTLKAHCVKLSLHKQ